MTKRQEFRCFWRFLYLCNMSKNDGKILSLFCKIQRAEVNGEPVSLKDSGELEDLLLEELGEKPEMDYHNLRYVK